LAVDKLHPPHHLCLATATDSNAIAGFQIQLWEIAKNQRQSAGTPPQQTFVHHAENKKHWFLIGMQHGRFLSEYL